MGILGSAVQVMNELESILHSGSLYEPLPPEGYLTGPDWKKTKDAGHVEVVGSGELAQESQLPSSWPCLLLFGNVAFPGDLVLEKEAISGSQLELMETRQSLLWEGGLQISRCLVCNEETIFITFSRQYVKQICHTLYLSHSGNVSNIGTLAGYLFPCGDSFCGTFLFLISFSIVLEGRGCWRRMAGIFFSRICSLLRIDKNIKGISCEKKKTLLLCFVTKISSLFSFYESVSYSVIDSSYAHSRLSVTE